MSATALQVFAVDIPNPEWKPEQSSDFHRLNSSTSFYFINDFDILTLSTNNADAGSDIQGLLYVPDLPNNDPCINASAPYVPANVTRQANLPHTEAYLIAMAPWMSPDCTQKYMASARLDPVKAFIFFLPDNSTAAPVNSKSSQWDLGDSDSWERDNPFPVYVIPGKSGANLLHESSLYSGNVTDVPNGHLLTESGLDSRDYVRLYVEINTSGGSTIPSLWVFLLIVLGILLSIIGLTSFTMHLLQRRRRRTLRRRVASGEVDLEALGIKRLTVPQEILDEMPLYTYGSGAPVAPPTIARETQSTTATALNPSKLSTPSSSRPSSPPPTARPTPALVRSQSYHPTPLDQPTCAICLDDFVPATRTSGSSADATETAGTIVRELPCHHIFHPECVDTFLKDSSSLCPMCKKTALPRGYCPRIVTNAMVRRERMVRRIRPEAEDADGDGNERARGGFFLVGWGLQRPTRSQTYSESSAGRRRIFSAPPAEHSMLGRQMTELSPQRPAATAARGVGERSSTFSLSRARSSRRVVTAPVSSGTVSSEENARPQQVQPPSTPSRREWARQRAVAMLGRDRAPVDPEAEDERNTGGWRKVVRRVFPWGRL